tara:strand:- start:530 stop:916 length:387 start_codon:yes stop_codon:yes gene_type:complete
MAKLLFSMVGGSGVGPHSMGGSFGQVGNSGNQNVAYTGHTFVGESYTQWFRDTNKASYQHNWMSVAYGSPNFSVRNQINIGGAQTLATYSNGGYDLAISTNTTSSNYSGTVYWQMETSSSGFAPTRRY